MKKNLLKFKNHFFAVSILFLIFSNHSVKAFEYGGKLIVAVPTEPQSLDPQRDSGGPSTIIQKSVLETLVRFDNDMNLQPGLATSWEVSQDGLRYKFYLRKNVKFHDGTNFNSNSVKFAFDRSLGLIGGKKNRYGKLISSLESVNLIDDYTVEFKLKKQYAPFLNTLVHTGFSILSPDAVKKLGKNYGKQPVGTGPYKIVEWKKGQIIKLEKFQDYWQENLPYLDSINFRILPDAQTRVAAIMAGEVNFVVQIPENLFSTIDAKPNLNAVKTQTLRTVFLRFNPQNEPFNDINVRKAFVHYTDADSFSNTILEGLHFKAAQPTQPFGVWGIAKDIEPYLHNPQKADNLLNSSGWQKNSSNKWIKSGNSLKFKLWTTTNRYPQDSNIAVAIKNNLNKHGMDVEVQTREWGAYRDSIFNKEYGVFLFGAGASTGDIDYVYSILFHGSSKYGQGPSAADDLLELARSTVNEKERLRLSKKFQEIIRDEYLWFPIYWMSQLVATNKEVQNFKPRQDEQFDFSKVWIK